MVTFSDDDNYPYCRIGAGDKKRRETRVAASAQNQKLFTIGLRCGRLANRLILFANFIALAEEQGHRVINFTFHILRRIV